MATVADLVNDTRGYLLSGQNEELNRLEVNLTSVATSLQLEFPAGGIKTGVTIAVGLEEMYVWSVVGQNATVQRAMNGSQIGDHFDGDLIRVKPKFTDYRIFRALNDDVLDLSAPGNGLFRMRTVDLTATGAQYGYDLTDVEEMLDVYEVRYKTPGPEHTWPRIRNYTVAQDMPTSDFPSGIALILHEAPYPGMPIRVRYKAPFGQFGSLGSEIADAGIAPSMVDLPPLGAAIRLMSGRDIKRSFTETQGEPRRAEEVRVGDAVNGMRGLLALRAQRIMAEAGRLQRLYPSQW